MMSRRGLAAGLLCCLSASVAGRPADSASGAFTAEGLGTITTSHAVAYPVRDPRNARDTVVEVLLSDVEVNAAPIRQALDPHLAAINAAELKSRNYLLLWVRADGSVSMNATFSGTMTQILNDSAGGLTATWTARRADGLEGHVSSATLKTMDGAAYRVDVTLGVGVPAPPGGSVLPNGGGEPGKALRAFLAAAGRKDWAAIRAASSANALAVFEKSYNSADENAADALDLVKAWITLPRLTITGGRQNGDVAILDVEGEMFPGTRRLSLVRMVRRGTSWGFDDARPVGLVR